MGVVKRGQKLYVNLKDAGGRWRQVATGFGVGERAKAEKWLADQERLIAADVKSAGAPALTVSQYAERWLEKRHTVTVDDDKTRLRKHALPVIGDMAMIDVKPRHLRDLVMAMRDAGKLAPKTIRQVSGLLHTMFKSAKIEEVIPTNPVDFERGVLPKPVDKDPTWRHEAIYTRSEIESLISDDRILPDRRVFYAIKALGALRHGEAAELRWSQYDSATVPLGAINLGKTKSGVPRTMPVHPTLARVLAAWKLSGWCELYGRQPTPDDLIVPTRNLTIRESSESQHQLVADLGLLGFRQHAGAKEFNRKRRGHDMRRTFITLARTDGAVKDILRWGTHGRSASDMMDVYSSFEWSTLCAEVAKLKLELLEGKLIEMPMALAAGADGQDLHAVRMQSTPTRKTSSKTSELREKKCDPSGIRTSLSSHLPTGSDTRDKQSPTLTLVAMSPSVTESHGTASGLHAVANQGQRVPDSIVDEIEQALTTWRAAGDAKVLRRALLRIVAELD